MFRPIAIAFFLVASLVGASAQDYSSDPRERILQELFVSARDAKCPGRPDQAQCIKDHNDLIAKIGKTSKNFAILNDRTAKYEDRLEAKKSLESGLTETVNVTQKYQ